MKGLNESPDISTNYDIMLHWYNIGYFFVITERATNVKNPGPDTAAIDAFCGLINKEPECAQVAAKCITEKVQSLHEWEALQALLVRI